MKMKVLEIEEKGTLKTSPIEVGENHCRGKVLSQGFNLRGYGKGARKATNSLLPTLPSLLTKVTKYIPVGNVETSI